MFGWCGIGDEVREICPSSLAGPEWIEMDLTSAGLPNLLPFAGSWSLRRAGLISYGDRERSSSGDPLSLAIPDSVDIRRSRCPPWLLMTDMVDNPAVCISRYRSNSEAALRVSRPTSAVYLGDSMMVSRNHRATTAGITPTPMIHRQIESRVILHWASQDWEVASAGMLFRCLAVAINVTSVAASWPRG